MGVDMRNVQCPASLTSKVQPVEFCPWSWSSEGSLEPSGGLCPLPNLWQEDPLLARSYV